MKLMNKLISLLYSIADAIREKKIVEKEKVIKKQKS